MEQTTKQKETKQTTLTINIPRRIVGTVFGVIEILLAFRLIFKLLGANPDNGFVHGLYTVTWFLIGIFEGIFSKAAVSGEESNAVFEPATLLSMVVIALIAWVVMKLMMSYTNTRMEKVEFSKRDDQ